MSEHNMEYRRLGPTGLQVSVLSLGSWVTFGDQFGVGEASECMQAAYEAGVNFFDNAEAYAGGESERIMGEAIAKLAWPRWSYTISTKVFWGLHEIPNMKNTLNRKYLMQAIDGSLERLGLEFVDLLFCHRADSNTPIEETVWAMSDIVASGRAHYWGTSEWTADEIRAAWNIAERHHLHKPVMEQPQYNLLARGRVEFEYLRLYEDQGLGLTTYSPLASGVLSGKYLDGIPEGSRASQDKSLSTDLLTDEALTHIRALAGIAADRGQSLAQLALAWALRDRRVTTVLIGASSVGQLDQNLGALDNLTFDPAELAAIDQHAVDAGIDLWKGPRTA